MNELTGGRLFAARAGILSRLSLVLLMPAIAGAGSLPAQTLRPADLRTAHTVDLHCRKLVLTGDVSAGQQWSVPIGQGWVFRVLPIAPSGHDYSGWDLVVDRTQDAGYPDALLLGTPPYGSLNEREIGTTFGLRAQDAIAWEPRRFHFLTSIKDMKRARELFLTTMPPSRVESGVKPDAAAQGMASAELLAMIGDKSRVAAGQFAVLDAKLKAGVADPPTFAQQWVMKLGQVPHTLVGSGVPTARGELLWVRFTVTIWLPNGWKALAGAQTEEAKCAE